MRKKVAFDLWVKIEGEVEVEDYNDDPNELLEAIFPNGWNGTIMDATTDPSFMGTGYVKATDIDDDA